MMGGYYYLTPAHVSSQLSSATYEFAILTEGNSSITPVHLEDITVQAGILRGHTQRSEHISGLHESLGAGACAFDYDHDGWVDILVLNGSGTTHFYGKPQWWQAHNNSLTLYRNNGDETFTDVTSDSGLSSRGWTMGCTYGDIDNDGDMDVFISQYGENQLWENNAGRFTNIAASSGIRGTHWSTSVTMVDVNRDGLLDIFVNNFIDFKVNALTFEHQSGYEATLPPAFDMALFDGQPNQLWINQGERRFIDAAKSMGVDNPQGRSLHAQWVDINGDAYPDVIVANGQGSSNKVFINQAGKTFADVSLHSGLSFTGTAHHINAINLHQDAQLDMIVGTDHMGFSKFYSQSAHRDPSFIDNSYQQLAAVTTANQSQWASVVEDINLDGQLDIYIANGLTTPNQDAHLLTRGQPDSLLLYQQGFIDYSQKLAFNTQHSHASRCALATDINNDGRADIYVSHNNQLGTLLKNTGKHQPWLGIELLSKTLPVNGAMVTVTTPDATHTQSYGNKHSFLCTGDQRLRWAVNDALPIDITIMWPDGSEQVLRDLEANRYHRIVYGDTPLAPAPHATPITSHILYQGANHKLRVAQWLIKQGRIETAVNELLLLQDHTDETVRLQRLQAASTLPHIQQLPFVQQGLTDDAIAVRLQAIALTRESENELLARWLFKQLEHTSDDVVCATTATLAHFYDEEEAFIVHKYSALSSLIRLLESPSVVKQHCAIEALGRSEHYRALQPLLVFAQGHTSETIRVAAIKAVALIKEKAALPVLKRIANNSNEGAAVRHQAVASIAIIGGALHHPVFTKPLRHNAGNTTNPKTPPIVLEHNQFYKTQPEFITPLLAATHSERVNILQAIATRKERWARDIVRTVLLDSHETPAIKTAIIQQLPRPLSRGHRQLLEQVRQATVAEYKTQVETRIQTQEANPNHLQHHEDRLMALAEIIYHIDPKHALELVLR